MSFGGATSAMIHSVKSNLALRRGRDHFFDRNIDLKTKKYIGEISKPSPQVREKFRQQLAKEQHHDRTIGVVSIILTLVIFVLLYNYLFA